MNTSIGPVAIVCHFPPPPGGMPGQAAALQAGLQAEGINVLKVPTNLGEDSVLHWVESIPIIRTIFRAPIFIVRLLSSVRRAKIVHVLSGSGLGFFLFTAPSVLVARTFGRSIVIHYHGGGADAFFGRGARLIRPIMRLANQIVVPSQYLNQIFQKYGLNSQIIPNILDVDAFPYVERNGRLEPKFVVARHLEPLYNVGCVIRAFAIVHHCYPSATLLVLGGGSQEALLRKLAQDLNLEGNVSFLGYVQNDKIPELYRNCSISLNASHSDNVPVAILEAFASGLAAVSTAAGGIAYLIEHGKTGLLVSLDDPEDMAAKIFELLKNPDLACRLITNARKVVENCRWQQVFPAWKEVYRMASPAAKPAASAN